MARTDALVALAADNVRTGMTGLLPLQKHRLAAIARLVTTVPTFTLEVGARPADAADAFRAAWLLDSADPQNAYRIIVYRSNGTSAPQIEKALASLGQIEGELTRLERPRATLPFRTTQAIDDDAGGAAELSR